MLDSVVKEYRYANQRRDIMSYAQAWLKWFPTIEQGATGLNERMLQLADLDRAETILDIGTGIGEPALSIASRIGSGGRVVAIDLDPAMIEIARERAVALGVANIEFNVSDIGDLDYTRQLFDVVVARWSLMFTADIDSLLNRLSTLLRPGGRIVAATWDEPEKVPAISLAKQVARDHLGLEPLKYGPGSTFGLKDPRLLIEALDSAGFQDILCEQVPVPYRFKSVDEYIDNRISLTGPLWDQIETVPDRTRAEVTRAIELAMRPHQEVDGSFLMVNTAHCIFGRI
jgi:ubiquinone/menaquinone biosynthesis C-methylase UbiE